VTGSNGPGIRVSVIEDHPIARLGLVTVLRAQEDVADVSEWESVSGAADHVDAFRSDLVVLPLRLDGWLSGIELCRDIKRSSGARVLIYTSFNDAEDASAAYLSGADSFVHKGTTTATFLEAVRKTSRGWRVWALADEADAKGARLRAQLGHADLTVREREVLGFMLQRFSNNEIARELQIEITTVKTHVSHVLQKLGMTSRSDLLTPGP